MNMLRYGLAAMALLGCLWIGTARADGPVVQSCQLAWDAPTTNADDSPLTDLAGYRLYLAQTPGGHDFNALPAIEVGPSTLTADCSAPSDGQWYAVATAFDTAGNQSVPSNEVSFVLDTLPPNAPLNLIISVTVNLNITTAN